MKKFLKIFIPVVFIGGGALITYSVYKTQKAIPNLLARLISEDVQDRFTSYATTINGKQTLQVARLNRIEVYERTSKAQAFGIRLPDVIASVQFPVEYNFNVSLAAPWKFTKRNNVLRVNAPELSSQTPAVNISQMKFEIRKGSFLRNETDVKEKLQKELTGYMAENSILLRSEVRAEARKAVEQFVRTWVASQFADVEAERLPIQVFFPGENDQAADALSAP